MRHNTGVCGRYYINTLPETLAEQFLVRAPADLAASFNIAPTHLCPIVARNEEGDRALWNAHWGLIPFWAKDRKIGSRTINARMETAASKPSYRAAFKKRRCLVPASGFYEWVRSGKIKQPQAISPTNNPLLMMAGLWETWRDESDQELKSFTIMTTEATGPISAIHHRMPLLLDNPLAEAWLSGELNDAAPVAEASPTQELTIYPVSTRVNSVVNNHPDLLQPLDDLAPGAGPESGPTSG